MKPITKSERNMKTGLVLGLHTVTKSELRELKEAHKAYEHAKLGRTLSNAIESRACKQDFVNGNTHTKLIHMKTETEYKHTPGPWLITDRGNCIVTDLDPIKSDVICSIHGDYHNNEQVIANTKLIAQAPSLLQERDTLKKDNAFLRGKIDEIEKEHRESSHKRLKVEEANKELIEALTRFVNFADKHRVEKYESSMVLQAKAALLKHRKGE